MSVSFNNTKVANDNYEDIVLNKNNIFRGKDLGTITSSNVDAFFNQLNISGGKFNDIYLGDHFIIQDGVFNSRWIACGFNPYANKGDNSTPGNHVALMPYDYLYNAGKVAGRTDHLLQMNDTNTTAGGYKGSKMYTTYLPAIVTQLKKVLGSHIISRRELISNSIDTSKPAINGIHTGLSNGWEWASVDAILPTEIEIYGTNIWSSSPYDSGLAQQLPLFKNESFVNNSRPYFWLRSVASASYFCYAGHNGHAYYYGASGAYYVRPLIIVR